MKTLRRVRNWDAKLVAWAERVRGEAFVWGETDCASLVREACAEMYGEELFLQAPSYESKKEALRVATETGGVEEALRRLGATEVGMTFARQGDVLVGENSDGSPGAAVVVDGKAVVSREKAGVFLRPLRQVDPSHRALQVPHEVEVPS